MGANRLGLVLLALLITNVGCNLCCPPYLDDYAAVGGKWNRSNPTDGRVGSAFTDPNMGAPTGFGMTSQEGQVIVEDPSSFTETSYPNPEYSEGEIILGEGW